LNDIPLFKSTFNKKRHNQRSVPWDLDASKRQFASVGRLKRNLYLKQMGAEAGIHFEMHPAL